MKSLVNDLLYFLMAILQIHVHVHCYFLLMKCENPLQRILTFYQQKVTVYLLFFVDKM